MIYAPDKVTATNSPSDFRPSGVLTLLSDFGNSDPFVGIMKGVILREHPSATIVDLTHAIEAQSVQTAGFWLERSYRYFAPGSVHVAVVDPGVGTARAALVTVADEHCFVAPDNGLLDAVLASCSEAVTFRVAIAELGLPQPSNTFHGRDVFAPLGARIAAGQLRPDAAGPPHQPQTNSRPSPMPAERKVEGHIVAVDHFGNLISDISSARLPPISPLIATLGGHRVPIARTYADVADGELVALINSFDRLEIAQRNGNAARTMKLGRGATLEVEGCREPSR